MVLARGPQRQTREGAFGREAILLGPERLDCLASTQDGPAFCHHLQLPHCVRLTVNYELRQLQRDEVMRWSTIWSVDILTGLSVTTLDAGGMAQDKFFGGKPVDSQCTIFGVFIIEL